MVTPTVRPAENAAGSRLYGIYVASLASCMFGNLLMRVGAEAGWFSTPVQVAIGVLTAAPMAVAAAFFWRLLRSELDEMLQRVVLEGLAFAFIVYVPISALYVNLRNVQGWSGRLDPPELILGPALLVAVGIMFARGRYQ
jgi:hypothetical protein